MKMSAIGPELPPHLRKNQDQSDASDSEDDAYGPALPPHLLKQKESATASSSTACQRNASVQNVQQENDSSSDSESSDGEIVGPLPPDQISNSYSSASEVERRALKMKRKLLGQEEDDNKEPQRESWMLELPELKRKNFGLGPRAFNRTDKPEITGRDEWTSKPGSEKKEKKEKDVKQFDAHEQYLEEKRNKELEKVVEKHDKSKRSKSLLSIHQHELKKKKQDDSQPKERKPFNRDEDLKTNQLDDARKKALIKRSQELNSKFSIGKQKFL